MKTAKKLDIGVCIVLAILTLAVFWEVRNFEFVNYDDKGFIVESPLIQSGITLESVKSAFKKDWGYWKPVACLSLMLDYEIYGMDAGGFHVTNLILHVANALLLFLFLRMITGAVWQSAFVAALFALHPLHVESVVWVSERKDVISAFFWMLTMLGYVYYLKRPCFGRYVLILVPMALGLMAKPILVTMPFILMLLDYWPLHRINSPWEISTGNVKNGLKSNKARRKKPDKRKRSLKSDNLLHRTGDDFNVNILRLIREKIPMMILVATSIIILLISYSKIGTDAGTAVSQSFGYKLSNALVSYVKYMEKMFLPQGLAIPYPYQSISWQKTGLAFIILLCISLAAIKTVKSRPYFAVGWFWYLGTLLPVLGLIEFGSFSMADRFTYIPLIGLFIIIAWAVPDLISKWRHSVVFLSTSGVIILIVLMSLTWKQVGYWKNSITLFEHTLKIIPNNYVAHNNLGIALKEQGLIDAAIKHYLEALRIKPDHVRAHNNLGIALEKMGKIDDAVEHYNEALRIKPDFEEVHNNLGVALKKQGRLDEAIEHFKEALRIKPDYEEAYNNLGVVLYNKGDVNGAVECFRKALEINPNYGSAKDNLKKVLMRQNKGSE